MVRFKVDTVEFGTGEVSLKKRDDESTEENKRVYIESTEEVSMGFALKLAPNKMENCACEFFSFCKGT